MMARFGDLRVWLRRPTKRPTKRSGPGRTRLAIEPLEDRCLPSGYSISGIVFRDTNGNGVRDSGEGGLAGWAVQLLDGSGNFLGQTTSNAAGAYAFAGLQAGSYTIRELPQTGWAQTAGPTGYNISLTSGGTLTGNNFGDFRLGTVSGTVFRDTNGNGVRDSGEAGLAGWAVQLRNGSGGVLQTATTDAAGHYAFTGLVPGSYAVTDTLSSGWYQTSTPVSHVTIATSGASIVTNFGVSQQSPARRGTIVGTLFADLNGNGVQDAGETVGLAGWTVYLDRNNNSVLDPREFSATTTSAGQFTFAGLAAGTYTVRQVTPSGWAQTSPVATVTLPTNNSIATVALGDKGTTSTVVIDSAWLEAHGPAPYLLTQANTTYVLATDVDVPGTAFLDAAANVVLDLNGHTVTYSDAAPLGLVNGGFEQGTTGWDLSGAPTATIVPAPVGMWGQSALQIANFTTPQTVVSSPVPLPAAGYEYAATITPSATSGTAVTLQVVDTVTGAVLASGSSDGATRGFAAVVKFTPTTTDAVELVVVITPPSGGSATAQLDGAGVFPDQDFGIVASQASWTFPAQLQTSAITSAVGHAANFSLQNGNIVQGQAQAYAGDDLYFHGMTFTVNGVSAADNGMDAQNLDASYASDYAVTNSTFNSSTDNISDRMLEFASLQLPHGAGRIVVSGNTILNSPDQGISLTQTSGEGPVTVAANLIAQDARVSDPYGINLVGVSNFTVAGNTITPVNGRGILLDGWNGLLSQDGQIYANYVTAQEGPDLEYSATDQVATALRIRNYGSAGQRDLSIYGNTFVATTGAGLDQGAMAARITQDNAQGVLTGADNLLADNVFQATVTAADPYYDAWAVSLAQVDAGTGLQLDDNVLESNDVSLNLGDNASWGMTNQGVLLLGNTLEPGGGGAARPYTAVVVGAENNLVHNINLVDTVFGSGASAVPSFAATYDGATGNDVELGWLLSVKAVAGSSGAPLAGATVQVWSAAGALVFSGTTDAAGALSAIPLAATTYTQTGTTSAAVTTTKNGPFRVVVSSGSKSVTQSIDPTQDTSLTFTL
jgi:protocatechuate 3,4-dioxygenase beta subunit